MSVIYLDKKRPKHQHYASLRRAVHAMADALKEQKESVDDYRSNIDELKDVMIDMQKNMLRFDSNLGAIRIDRLGEESRKLAQIMHSARATC